MKINLQLAIKRLIDICVSLIAVVTLSPVLCVLVFIIRVDSPGAAIFSQVRWGVNRTKIRVYKFRTMRTELCDASGFVQTVHNDPRLTTIGVFLRKNNLDELPQLFNVLRGDMSLIGPRCHPMGMLAAGVLYEDLIPDYHMRHLMRPGITGLAQIRGFRGPTIRTYQARARFASDVYYIKHFSLWLDFKILIATIRNEILGGSGF